MNDYRLIPRVRANKSGWSSEGYLLASPTHAPPDPPPVPVCTSCSLCEQRRRESSDGRR